MQPLKTVYAVENKSAKFICTVTGNPKPTITWSKGMRELSEGIKYAMLKEGDTYTLVISGVYGEDADEYACRAVNKGGSRTSRAELIIKSQLLFLSNILMIESCLTKSFILLYSCTSHKCSTTFP